MTKARQDYPRRLPSDELICLPFLDTDTTADMPIADAELRSRGYPHWVITLMRRIAAVGLWYQVFAWEWASLDAFDVMLGYVPIGLALALMLATLKLYALGGFTLGLSLLLLVAAVIGAFVRSRRSSRGDA